MNADEILNNTDPNELKNLLKRLKIDQKAGLRPPPTIIVNQAPAQYPPVQNFDNTVDGDLTVNGNVIADNIGLDYFSELVTYNGYAAEHVNGNTYRWNTLASVTLSGTTYQAITYWDKEGYLVIGKRVLDGEWTFYEFQNISISGGDNHFVSVIGIDPNGYVHVCYDMHDDGLKYRKSNAPISSWLGTLTGTLSMLGTHETQVAYPTFINDPSGNLYFMFRDGGSGNGDLYFYKYAHATTSWAAATGTGTGGKLINGKTSSVNPYWDHPAFDDNFGSGGYMHLSWHWRESGAIADNHDVLYVKWDGTNWKQANGSSQTMPVTEANAEVVDLTGDNTGMTSFNSLDADSLGHAHIVYPKTVGGVRNLYHAHYNGSAWVITTLTRSDGPDIGDFTATGIDLTPAIAIERTTDTVYVFYVDYRDVPGILAMVSDPNDYTEWHRICIYPYAFGWWAPRYDYTEWARTGTLYMSLEFFDGSILSGNHGSFPIRVLRWVPGLDEAYEYEAGDMYRDVYDPDQDGVVDNAEQLQGHPASYFAPEAPSDGAQYARKDGQWVALQSGAGQVTVIARFVSSGGTTFDLPDLAEYIIGATDNGSLVDPLTYSLSSNRTQIVFDSAITASHVVVVTYVIVQV